MVTAVASHPTPTVCEGERGGCRFSRRRVYFYLLVMRQAHLAREPFDVVLRSETRNSRLIDPAVRGTSTDPMEARAIGWAIEDAGARHGINVGNPHNADRLAAVLCPEHHDVDER